MNLKDKAVAVVGASNDPDKYGGIVFKDLLKKNINAIPINPRQDMILGHTAYHNLNDFEGNIDIVVFVVPPEVTEDVLIAVKELGIKTVWMQPGSSSQIAIDFCRKNDIKEYHRVCIMVQGDAL
ncbi:MAG: CoA-binding protein [Nanoarchaeota archaeon]|nr:CoA-binding protein [Nanoarchaeota archaeon]